MILECVGEWNVHIHQIPACKKDETSEHPYIDGGCHLSFDGYYSKYATRA